jgi:RNA polymerase sigma-70 factor (ECF subfamily)
MYRACYHDLLTYALRRTARPEVAADVVADTFLIAWRRIRDIPPEQARLWLFGVARKVLAGHHRQARRRVDLAVRLRTELRHVEVEESGADDELKSAFRSLPGSDQEMLRLVAWEGLTADQLAQTLGCSANAARIRLHRARRRFADALRSCSLTT